MDSQGFFLACFSCRCFQIVNTWTLTPTTDRRAYKSFETWDCWKLLFTSKASPGGDYFIHIEIIYFKSFLKLLFFRRFSSLECNLDKKKCQDVLNLDGFIAVNTLHYIWISAPAEQTKGNLKVTSPEDAEHVSRRQAAPNGTGSSRGEAKGSRTVPRRHTLGGARSSKEILAMQPSDMDKKREAFLEHLKQKYPHHASAIMGHQERLREQVSGFRKCSDFRDTGVNLSKICYFIILTSSLCGCSWFHRSSSIQTCCTL